MTPDEIIKAMDEFAALQEKANRRGRSNIAYVLEVASRSIPAAEAAALIREMREMMTVMNNSMLIRGGRCVWCDNHTGHTPDCKLADIVGGNQ